MTGKHRLAYPTRWYYSDKCNECSGHGFIEDYEAGRKNTCHVCKGSGKRMTFSPFRDYEIPMPENLASGFSANCFAILSIENAS